LIVVAAVSHTINDRYGCVPALATLNRSLEQLCGDFMRAELALTESARGVGQAPRNRDLRQPRLASEIRWFISGKQPAAGCAAAS
jgi:hypothetical protein